MTAEDLEIGFWAWSATKRPAGLTDVQAFAQYMIAGLEPTPKPHTPAMAEAPQIPERVPERWRWLYANPKSSDVLDLHMQQIMRELGTVELERNSMERSLNRRVLVDHCHRIRLAAHL